MIENGHHVLIPAGTHIVTLASVKTLNARGVCERGAVGVIQQVPTDGSHSYTVEFADGRTATMKQSEMAISKEFQTGDAFQDKSSAGFREYIIYKCVVGSRAFGLDDENSDTDWRGIYLPPADTHWGLYGVPEQLENKETEECYWELQKFVTLALKANPNILECLNTSLIEYSNELAEELLSMKDIFLSKLVYQTYNGYVMSQFKKIEQDLRARGEIKWKHAMHLIRLLMQGISILETGRLEVGVGENKELLVSIKRGKMEWDEVNAYRLKMHERFSEAFNTTKLPERPDYERANAFLIRARRSML